MKRLSIMLLISLTVISCSGEQRFPNAVTEESILPAQSQEAVIPESPSPTTSASTLPTATVIPDITSSHAATITLQSFWPTWEVLDPQDALIAIINSSYWQRLGFSQEQMSEWQGFVEGKSELSTNEEQELKSFLSQWKKLNELAENSQFPPESRLDFQVKEFQGDQGEKKLIVYTIDGQTMDGESGAGLFLIVRYSSGEEVSLMPAPKIEGFTQQISVDGEKVEYYDPNGTVMLIADAVALQTDVKEDKALTKGLSEVYRGSSYNIHLTYPRFRFPIPGVKVDFFAIEKLTYHQVLLLKTALELFERQDLQALMPSIFNDGKGYIIDLRMDDRFSGMASSGSGIAWLDPEKIVGNRYYLAEVIAHEAAHLLQEPTSSCDVMLKYEIGNGTIPPELYAWRGDELMGALKAERIGAYHVSLWVLSKLGIQDLGGLNWIIQNGRYNKQMILINCP